MKAQKRGWGELVGGNYMKCKSEPEGDLRWENEREAGTEEGGLSGQGAPVGRANTGIWKNTDSVSG